MDKTAVIIPCYNESLTIGKVIDTVKEKLPHAVIYVYDNNSTDDTAQIAAEHGAVVRFAARQGKGNTLQLAFDEVNAECYITIDGDDAIDLSVLPYFEKAIVQQGYDMAVGTRGATYFDNETRRFHGFGNKLVNALVRVFFGKGVNDVMCGYRAMNYATAKTIQLYTERFEVETELSVRALNYGLHIQNIDVIFRNRPDGSVSSMDTVKDGMSVLRFIFDYALGAKAPQVIIGLIAIFVLVALIAPKSLLTIWVLPVVILLFFLPIVWAHNKRVRENVKERYEECKKEPYEQTHKHSEYRMEGETV